jgi:hypothetical protein
LHIDYNCLLNDKNSMLTHTFSIEILLNLSITCMYAYYMAYICMRRLAVSLYRFISTHLRSQPICRKWIYSSIENVKWENKYQEQQTNVVYRKKNIFFTAFRWHSLASGLVCRINFSGLIRQQYSGSDLNCFQSKIVCWAQS